MKILKNAVKFTIFMFYLFLLAGCTEQTFQSRPTQFFMGKHNLMSLNSLIQISEKSKTTMSGSFFVALGGFNYDKENIKREDRVVHFVWENNSKEFVISEIPMSLVRFQLDTTDSIKSPYCKFRWRDDERSFNEARWMNEVIYVVFILRKNQIYNANIKLDLK
jgi:hypothetical protein